MQSVQFEHFRLVLIDSIVDHMNLRKATECAPLSMYYPLKNHSVISGTNLVPGSKYPIHVGGSTSKGMDSKQKRCDCVSSLKNKQQHTVLN